MIYNPSEDFDSKYKALHKDKTAAFFDELVKRSGVDAEANRKTVAEYNACEATEKKLKKKLLLWRILRVLMIITIVLIPLVIFKITPMIKALREEFTHTDDRSNVLLAEAQRQMQPLNSLFSDGDALRIIESTIPLINFAPCFSAQQEENMRVNYDFKCDGDGEESSVGVLAGEFSIKALISLASSTLKGEALQKHYQAYPATPEDYPAWEKKALKLWKKAGSMADTVKDA
jgi:hypothetical protein